STRQSFVGASFRSLRVSPGQTPPHASVTCLTFRHRTTREPPQGWPPPAVVTTTSRGWVHGECGSVAEGNHDRHRRVPRGSRRRLLQRHGPGHPGRGQGSGPHGRRGRQHGRHPGQGAHHGAAGPDGADRVHPHHPGRAVPPYPAGHRPFGQRAVPVRV